MSKPRLVAWLGYGGLIPFLALAALTCVDRVRVGFWHTNLCAYGALILSFVGALHWGFAMAPGSATSDQRNAMFAWSVVPCLMGFAALLAQSLAADLVLISGFLLQYWQDRRIAAVVSPPPWYLPLRLQLTAIAVVCLAAGSFASANL